MENTTSDKIFYTSFRLFLENGYEATNIRDICKEVGVKASTIYFYYKSKQDLFFYIYDDIRNDYLTHLLSIEKLNNDSSLKDKLYLLLIMKINYYMKDMSRRKFVLRCHLFPPEEISNIIREKYKFYSNEENKIMLDIMGIKSFDNKSTNEEVESLLLKCKKLEDHLVHEMMIYNTKICDEAISKLWDIYFELI
ncbi:TetR/AcrR family transcriptional regulator [Clostridium sp. C2-6-12]|uniref:TetR/AcrR family transcriptional regulator n=1 Tax=Clostridium sp. C2-6-12 TaxID=2698832 RepID=UPI00136EBB8C|nr:TetR/AcrR family transcriptional regulator [Clostridium sp. C2-6-12]